VLVQLPVASLVREEALRHEVFGPAALVLRCANLDQVEQVLAAIGGSLTVPLRGAGDDTATLRRLLRAARAIAGRVLFGAMPAGLAVSAGRQHDGPWPSSTAPFSSSVGDAALH
jgi:NADP-dependent aldehyde dehydrogenase